MKITYVVEAKFGSEFQKKSAIGAMEAIWKGWLEFYNYSHKKNKIKVTATKEGK